MSIYSILDWTAFNFSDLYNIIRVTISRIISHCAVPIFFLISGYLFFQGLHEWDTKTWKRKIRSRVKTLLIPYILWILFFILFILAQKVGGIVLHGKPISGIAEWWSMNHGLRMFWDSSVWCIGRKSLLGIPAENTGPILVPFVSTQLLFRP